MAESGVGPMRIDSEVPASLAREILERFQLNDLRPLLQIVESQATKRELNLAVLGRFNAGKSSFLNHLLGRPLLPIGVVPVTSVVPEICFGPHESASVVFQKNRAPQLISLAEVASFTSEAENPRNFRGVEVVRAFLPSLASFGNLTLVDTPGLESLLSQSTEASLSWSPHVDLALVAVPVDSPLTQQDIALIQRLRRFTPNVSVVLTKVDTLDDAAQKQVLDFVQTQLSARFPESLPVFPFSNRPGYEHLGERFEREYLSDAVHSFEERLTAALARKLQTLLSSVADYLHLALKSAEAWEADRARFRERILGSENSLADEKLQLQLLAKHAAARTRLLIEQRLREVALAQIQRLLAERFASEFPHWRASFARTLSLFETWLDSELTRELASISDAQSDVFQEPLRDVQRQSQRNLQLFREQISEKALLIFGIPLRTTEVAIQLQPPHTPDVSVGKIFDRNWELLSALIPMTLVRGLWPVNSGKR
jgi:GTP-binding protein EngB required for normal cell division